MKVVVISNTDEPGRLVDIARSQGYITFIYSHVDPDRVLTVDKFMYIHSDEELAEKINLLRSDVSVQDEVIRW